MEIPMSLNFSVSIRTMCTYRENQIKTIHHGNHWKWFLSVKRWHTQYAWSIFGFILSSFKIIFYSTLFVQIKINAFKCYLTIIIIIIETHWSVIWDPERNYKCLSVCVWPLKLLILFLLTLTHKSNTRTHTRTGTRFLKTYGQLNGCIKTYLFTRDFPIHQKIYS